LVNHVLSALRVLWPITYPLPLRLEMKFGCV
jgi:hypothetical protein